MNKDQLNLKLIKSFCKEFQSVWLIDVSDYSMTVYTASDEVSDIPDYMKTVPGLNHYDKARLWYIDHFVLEQYRERLRTQTKMDFVLMSTEEGKPFFIGYARTMKDKVNYNQLCYDRITDDDGKVQYIVMGFRDIDERKNADVDPITGLLTRNAFFKRAEEMISHNPDTQFDIVISDIVDFKEVNEMYGIDKADQLLGWIGSVLSKSISERVLVGRYGSDQIVVLGDHETVSVYMTSEEAESLNDAAAVLGLPRVVVKIGIYENIDRNCSILANCDKAYCALNKVKNHYKNFLGFYDENLEKQMQIKRKIESSMHDSLQNGDFVVYYQPKHDAVSGNLVGAEALVRWIHPQYGFMSPNDFIPLFEKNGFVVEIDDFVWKRTCENISRWQSSGLKTVPVSVNASKLSFIQPDFVKKLQKHVADNSISPKQMHIEITETLMTEDVDDLIMKLSALRAIGFGVELDDFGAGYSSINVLSTLPIDTVKLDMSFMRQFDNEKRIKVLASCISLARELGYNTISEGVEYREQSDILEALGVDMIQGYLYSKPLCEEDFEKYLTEKMK